MASAAGQPDPFDGHNFQAWKSDWSDWLTASKGWIDPLDSPAPAANWTPERTQQDKQVLAYLRLSVLKRLRHHVQDATSVHQAMQTLRRVYESSLAPRVAALEAQLGSLRMNTGESVTSYVSRGAALKRDLQAAGVQIDESHLIRSILNGLPASFGNFRTSLRLKDNFNQLTLEQLSAYMEAEEYDMERDHAESALASMHVGQSSQGGRGGSQPRRGHSRGRNNGGRGRGRGASAERTCWLCKKTGHIQKDCPKLRRFEEFEAQQGSVALVLLDAQAALAAGQLQSSDWIVDSGCTTHMTGNAAMLADFQPLGPDDEQLTIQTADGMLRAEGQGMAFLEGNITLHEVQYVPGLKFNLVATHTLMNKGADIHMLHEQRAAVISKGDWSRTVPLRGKLFILEGRPAGTASYNRLLAEQRVQPAATVKQAAVQSAAVAAASSTPGSTQRGASVSSCASGTMGDTSGTSRNASVSSDAACAASPSKRTLDRVNSHASASSSGERAHLGGNRFAMLVEAAQPPATAPVATVNPPVEAALFSSTGMRTDKVSPQLLHRRYNHASYTSIAYTLSVNAVSGVPTTCDHTSVAKCQHCTCEACVMGRHANPSFRPSKRKYEPLGMLSTDLVGRMPDSLSKRRWMITLVDHATGFVMVGFLSRKNQASDWLQDSINYLETQTGRRVKALRSDRGGEYSSEQLAQFLRSKGIAHQFAATGMPQQNGVAERVNRTILSGVRSMLYESGLSPALWAEAASARVHTLNLTARQGSDKTPTELLFGSKPDIAHLRVFGSVAFVKKVRVDGKLEPTSIKGVLVGYSERTKGYRVYVQATHQVLESPAVLVDETDSGPASLLGANSIVMHELFPDNPTPPPVMQPVPQPGVTQQGVPVPEPEQQAAQPPGAQPAAQQQAGQPPGAQQQQQAAQPPAGQQQAAAQLRRSSRLSAATTAQQPQRGRGWRPKRPRTFGPDFVTAAVEGSVVREPQTVAEALSGPQKPLWEESIQNELRNMMEYGVFKLVPAEQVPVGVKPIPSRLVFKVKTDQHGRFEQCKARLVAKGFKQTHGVDFEDISSPVCAQTALRALLAVTAARNWHLHQLDVTAAFLNGELEEEVYMAQPDGYNFAKPGMVCKLQKAIYGLKQAPRAWYSKLRKELEGLGFRAATGDPGMFILTHRGVSTYLIVHVDDMLIAGPDLGQIQRVKQLLGSAFKVKDMSECSFFLGMEVSRDRATCTLRLTQSKYTQEVLRRFNMQQCKPARVPMASSVRLTAAPSLDGAFLEPGNRYAELVGALMYLATHTRPDIAKAVSGLSRYMGEGKPTTDHMKAAVNVLRYLAGTVHRGIVYSGGLQQLRGYSDADWAGDTDTRRSTTAYAFILHGGVISWTSKVQPTVATSTTEAETMAVSAAVKEALWLRQILPELGEPVEPVLLLVDNKGAVDVMRHPNSTKRTKHIDIMHHFAKERAMRGEVHVEHVSTDLMVADALTKPLDSPKFEFCMQNMGLNK